MENHNVFAGAFVDRSGDRRKDPDWLSNAAKDEQSRFVPVWGDQCLVGNDPLSAVLLKRTQIESVADQDLIFLGVFRDHPAFAVPFSADEDAPYKELGEFQDLWFLGTALPPDEANLLAHARALVLWHASQVYCGICGSSARPNAAGNSRVCTNPDCGREIYPRVDPAIIVLVCGRRSLPLGPAKRLAGRTILDDCRVCGGRVKALRMPYSREVFEETNIRVGKCQLITVRNPGHSPPR